MKLTSYLFVLAICMSAMPQMGSAQGAQIRSEAPQVQLASAPDRPEIKFVVPVNLTNLLPALEDVSVHCTIQSDAVLLNPPSQEARFLNITVIGTPIPVVNGRVTANVEVVLVVPKLENPAGKTASYSCRLMGNLQGPKTTWTAFQSDHSYPALVLPVQPLQGTFPLVD